MPDEVTPDAPIPEPAPIEAPIPSPEPIPEPIQPEIPPEPPTAQIPANEPFDSAQDKPTPAPEPLPPQPAPQAQVPAPVFAPVLNYARDLAIKARAVIQGRKRKKLDKILEFVAAKGSVTNDQVEKLLHVSDATATRYLTQLEKEGKLQQTGKTGKSVKYTKY